MSIEEQNIDELVANKDKPLVMAYIGYDSPHRGDSKGSIGMAKLVSQMIGGRYVYVDIDMLEALFPLPFKFPRSYEERTKLDISYDDMQAIMRKLFIKLCKRIGSPDVMIGTSARPFKDKFPAGLKRPFLIESAFNESISNLRINDSRTVSHHLSKELLRDEAKKFKHHYPEITGELCAVMMGGEIFEHSKEKDAVEFTVKKLLEIGAHYDDITFFICPSLRTHEFYIGLMQEFAARMNLVHRGKEFLKQVKEGACFESGNIRIVGLSFDAAIEGYNPYLGLLGRADHIVQVGDSGSITSEALYTDKTVYLYQAHAKRKLLRAGHIVRLENLKDAPFPTKAALSADATYAVASALVKDFKKNAYGQIVNLPVPLDVYEPIKKIMGAPAIT